MKKHQFIPILLICFGLTLIFTSCKKDEYDYTLEGKWKLSSVNYYHRDVVLHGIHVPFIDFTENIEMTYDFQKNNKLVITFSTSEEVKISEHLYTYSQANYHPFYNPGPDNKKKETFEGSYILEIDGTKHSCVVSPVGVRSIWIDGFTTCGDGVVIDEVDMEVLKHDGIYVWWKTFYESK